MSRVNGEPPATKRQGRGDWTGLAMAGLTAPVFFFFVYLGKAEMGFTISVVFCMAMIAIKLRWKFRKQAWFWITILAVLVLHVPLFFLVRWPQTKIPMIAFSMPFGIADFLLISGAISLTERLFSEREDE